MRSKKTIYSNSEKFKSDINDRNDLIQKVQDTVVAWFCNDNNRVVNKIKVNSENDEKFRAVNERLTQLVNISVNEIIKISEENDLFFWDIYDCFSNMLLVSRLPVIHNTPEELIPEDIKEFIKTEKLMKERVEYERKILEESMNKKQNTEVGQDVSTLE